MIRDFERYHGVVLRRLVVESDTPISINKHDSLGRINSFLIGISDVSTFVHIKHCAKRLPPWQFSFTREQISEVAELNSKFGYGWLIFVCGIDGLVSLSYEEFVNMVVLGSVGGATVRIDRSPRKQYRVSGKSREAFCVKPEGVFTVLIGATERGRIRC